MRRMKLKGYKKGVGDPEGHSIIILLKRREDIISKHRNSSLLQQHMDKIQEVVNAMQNGTEKVSKIKTENFY